MSMHTTSILQGGTSRPRGNKKGELRGRLNFAVHGCKTALLMIVPGRLSFGQSKYLSCLLFL